MSARHACRRRFADVADYALPCDTAQPSTPRRSGHEMRAEAKCDGHDDDAVGCNDPLDALIAFIDGRCSGGCCGMLLRCARRDPAAHPCAWRRRSAVLCEAVAAGTAPSRRPPRRQVIVGAEPLAGSGGHLLMDKADQHSVPVVHSLSHVTSRSYGKFDACNCCWVTVNGLQNTAGSRPSDSQPPFNMEQPCNTTDLIMITSQTARRSWTAKASRRNGSRRWQRRSRR